MTQPLSSFPNQAGCGPPVPPWGVEEVSHTLSTVAEFYKYFSNGPGRSLLHLMGPSCPEMSSFGSCFYLCCDTRMMGLKWPASWLSFSGQEGLLLLLPLREGISVGIRVGSHLA